MEFVLTLKEALARMPTQPPPEFFDMAASTLLVPLEYETLNRICCPQCGGHKWERYMQLALAAHRQDLEWPYMGVQGDELRCRCMGCGHLMTVTFWFSK